MATAVMVRRVDQSAIRVNQVFQVGLLILAFLLNSIVLAGFVALVMLVSSTVPGLALFTQIYRRLLQPSGIVKPDVVPDNPEPHRFAQGFGGTVVALGVLALATGAAGLGWALVWLVALLAAANLFLGFCAGCFMYYQLNRLGVPGFRHGRVTRG